MIIVWRKPTRRASAAPVLNVARWGFAVQGSPPPPARWRLLNPYRTNMIVWGFKPQGTAPPPPGSGGPWPWFADQAHSGGFADLGL